MASAPPLPPRKSSLPGSTSSQDSRLSRGPARTDTLHLLPEPRLASASPHRGRTQDEAPPPYSEGIGVGDPRSSSMHSLRPIESAGVDRRTLLLVYIHGWMGNETSFQSFPAHVHNLLTVAMSDSHVVHTKIYPKYRSRKSMDNARDNFSSW